MKLGRYPLDFIGITYGYHVGKCLDFGWNDSKGGKNVPIYSMFDGVVKPLEKQTYGGNVCYIEHDDKTVGIYAHLSKFTVKAGQKVKMGEQIGNMGNTGRNMPYHTHIGIASSYATRYKNTTIDPIKVLEVYPDQEVAGGSVDKYDFIYWTEKETYTTGLYKTLIDMNVRKGPGTNFDRVLVKEMSKSGQENATSTNPNSYGVYNDGTVFRALEIIKNDKNEYWARGYSGYVCLEYNDGTIFCDKVE